MTRTCALGLLPLRNSNETLAELRPRNLIKVTPQKGFHPLAERKPLNNGKPRRDTVWHLSFKKFLYFSGNKLI